MDEPTTIRDVLEAAVPAEEPVDAPAAEPVVDVPAPDPEPAPSEPVAEAQPTEAAPADEKRDEKGRFKRKEEAAAATQEPAQGITPGPKSEPKVEAKERAPASWRPEVREHWNQLPPAVRAEVMRREQEVQKTLKETAEARQNIDALSRTIAPYEMLMKAEGASPLQAIDNLLATAARLRTAPAPDLANLVAGMVKQYGVGRFGNSFIEQLDAALAGSQPQVDPVAQQIEQRLAPVTQFMSQFQMQQQAAMEQARSAQVAEVSDFLEKAEFGHDVREEMADLMEVARRRGRELSLQDAYRQACIADPRIRGILEGRAKAKGAQQLNTTAQRAKAAAVSVSGAPAIGAPQAAATDIRSAIEGAIAMHAR